MKIDQEFQYIITDAFYHAQKYGHHYLTPEHLLLAALENFKFTLLLQLCHIDINNLENAIRKHIHANNQGGSLKDPIQTVDLQEILERAYFSLTNPSTQSLSVNEFLLSLLQQRNSFARICLEESGLTLDYASKIISYYGSLSGEELVNQLALLSDETLQKRGIVDQDIRAIIKSIRDSDKNIENKIEEFSKEGSEKNQNADSKQGSSLLELYTTNITQKARNNELELVVERPLLLERMGLILSRRIKNNPLLVGEPGVGKSALVEGLALAIANKTLPPYMQNIEIYSLDLGALIAGTRYRGDFEERVQLLLSQLKEIKSKVVLFIDEIHMIIGAGAVSGGSMDVSNLLKPVLAKGVIGFIGATTYDEYNKILNKDRALIRRFQKIDVNEPNEDETFAILQGIQEKFSQYHNVFYSDEVLKSIIRLSNKHLLDKFQPDKAIDIMDEAGAFVKFKHQRGLLPSSQVDNGVVASVVANIAKVPHVHLHEDNLVLLKKLQSNLEGCIFGQEKAISLVCDSIKRAQAGFSNTERPISSFLFVGPTGVGKTELAKQLAKFLDIELVRFDMSEYMEKAAVSKLIGSPPGYIGYDDGALLIDKIRKNPSCVLLLDEIEKAHPSIFNILLQIMDYGTLSDNKGNNGDFRNVILIMTSNVGIQEASAIPIGFDHFLLGPNQHAIDAALKRTFSAEFRNRLDKVVFFNALNIEQILRIIDKEIFDFTQLLKKKGISFSVTQKAKELIANLGFSPDMGARNLSHIFDQKVKNPLIDEILFGRLSKGEGKVKLTTKVVLTNDNKKERELLYTINEEELETMPS